MGFRRCPHCGKTISDNSRKCPGCNTPHPFRVNSDNGTGADDEILVADNGPRCQLCGGDMRGKLSVQFKPSGAIGGFFVASLGGAMSFQFPPFGWMIGFPFLVLGLAMMLRLRPLLACSKCGHEEERSSTLKGLGMLGVLFLVYFVGFVVIGLVATPGGPVGGEVTDSNTQRSPQSEKPQTSVEEQPSEPVYSSEEIELPPHPLELKIGERYGMTDDAVILDGIEDWRSQMTMPKYTQIEILDIKETDLTRWYYVQTYGSAGDEWRKGWVPASRLLKQVPKQL